MLKLVVTKVDNVLQDIDKSRGRLHVNDCLVWLEREISSLFSVHPVAYCANKASFTSDDDEYESSPVTLTVAIVENEDYETSCLDLCKKMLWKVSSSFEEGAMLAYRLRPYISTDGKYIRLTMRIGEIKKTPTDYRAEMISKAGFRDMVSIGE